MGLGLAKTKNAQGQTIYVSVVEYDPPGNIHDEFADNVLEPGAHPRGPPVVGYSMGRKIDQVMVNLRGKL